MWGLECPDTLTLEGDDWTMLSAAPVIDRKWTAKGKRVESYPCEAAALNEERLQGKGKCKRRGSFHAAGAGACGQLGPSLGCCLGDTGCSGRLCPALGWVKGPWKSCYPFPVLSWAGSQVTGARCGSTLYWGKSVACATCKSMGETKWVSSV